MKNRNIRGNLANIKNIIEFAEDTAEKWVQSLNCPVIRGDGTKAIEENINLIKSYKILKKSRYSVKFIFAGKFSLMKAWRAERSALCVWF